MDKNSVEELNKVLDFNFKNSLSLKPMTVYCPHCMTLYSVNPHEILVPKPIFKCRSCSDSFFINYPECISSKSILGKPLERVSVNEAVQKIATQRVKVSPNLEGSSSHSALVGKIDPKPKLDTKTHIKSHQSRMKPCPKCKATVDWSKPECRSCGLILEKLDFESGKYIGKKPSKELLDLWKIVVGDYQNKESHSKFISFANLEENLKFANIKYNNIIEANPSDEIARQMRTQISSLASVQLKPEAFVRPVKFSIKKYFTVFNVFFVSIVALCLSSYYFFELKNILGLLAFLVSLTLGLKIAQKLKI